MIKQTVQPISILCRSQSTYRWFSTTQRIASDKLNDHKKLLRQFYGSDILKSIEITEASVKPKDLLELKLKGNLGKSKVAPTDETFDYTRNDPEWEQPIVYPNQGLGRAPYPQIPNVNSPDGGDMKIRFKDAPIATNRPDATVSKTPQMIAKELAALTGLDEQYIRRLYVRPLIMKRVSLKTGKGNIANFFVMSVVGDQNGMVGIGIGKSRDGIRTAATKAHWTAVKNLRYVNRYEDRTILGSFEHKLAATKLKYSAAPVGFGLRVNKTAVEICRAAGIKDLRGKVFKSRNPMLVAKCFFEALTNQKTLDTLAANRGKKVVDVARVYYSH
ncbi:37S ribosomal protein S5, mitochondrial [Candida viswanathii]|jgi:small subunit ribosomal protein S5|uniref:Small ribosomal subunit protein uS5m n=1 Tax=Candida viswanathii TaxID=5486 RepID=A0A367YB73_9ASCO|nr:37S ribosomal protein S5, mitochondrial [Candida viswanathii]